MSGREFETPIGMAFDIRGELCRDFKHYFFLGSAVFATALLGILTRNTGYLATLWISNAILLGLFVRNPQLACPAGWFAAFIGYIAADCLTDPGFEKAILLTLANLLSVAVGFFLYMRIDSEDRKLKRPLSILILIGIVLIVCLVGGAASAFISPYLFGVSLKAGFGNWFSAEILDFMAVLPVMLTLPEMDISRLRRRTDGFQFRFSRIMPAIALGITFVLSIIIGGPGAFAFPVPALLWCALTYQLFITALFTMIFCIGTIMILFLGSTYAMWDISDPNTMLSLRIGISMLALAPLSVGSVMLTRNDLLSKLEHFANFDTLTHVYNRNGFYLQVDRMGKALMQRHESVSVLMLDLDYFKQINDMYGHAAGDLMLARFAQIARGCLREEDVMARIGGEEFAAILPDCSLDNAAMIAERIQKELDLTAVDYEGHQLTATVSIGIAHSVKFDGNIDHLLSKADKALYYAKQTGRNQVIVAED